MKYLSITLGIIMAGIVATGANAQNSASTAAPPPAASATSLPNVESIDILKQNQAERSREQPGNQAPTYRIVKDGSKHFSTLPGLETGVLIQGQTRFPGQARETTAGEAWRQYLNGPLTKYGSWLLIIALITTAATYFFRGQIKAHAPLTGRLIERFTPSERTLHWTMAISFVTLAVSGLILWFGKYVLLPVFGLTLFGWLAFLCKNIHNFVGPIFTISIILFFIHFVKDNLPKAADLKWISKFGGLFSGEHVSSGRFNAGEKIVFWGVVVVLGIIISVTGLMLNMLLPGIEYTRANMQIAIIIHIAASVLAMVMIIGHIYLGTIGMEGAYSAMRTGYVDETWAKQHHDLWLADIESGKIPRVRSEQKPIQSTANPALNKNA